MKSAFTDFLLSGGLLGLLFAASLALVAQGLSPLAQAWCGPYHVIVDVLGFLFIYGLLSGLALQLLLKMKPLQTGSFDMATSPVFTYWKLLTVLHMLGQGALTPFTSVFTKPLVARLFGARIGGNVALGGTIGEPFLVSVGDGAVLGFGSVVAGSVIADGRITLGRVQIGDGATLGVYSVAMGDVEIGKDAKLIGGSFVLPGTKIPPGEVWKGNPARKWIGGAGAAVKGGDAG